MNHHAVQRFLAVGVLAMAFLAHAGESSVTGGLAALQSVNTSPSTREGRLAEMERVFATQIAPGLAAPGAMSNDDLAAAFDAVDMLAFYAVQGTQAQLDGHVETMSRLFSAIEARGAVTPRHAGMMFDALISSRAFDSARQLVKRYPATLEGRTVPNVAYAPHFDAARPAVLELVKDGSLIARNVDRRGDHVVAIVGCHVSEQALAEINALPGLADALVRSGTRWLIPADRTADASILREWNARHPRQPAAFAYANAAWTHVEFASMPHFQRFRDDRRVANLRGWERGGGAAQIAPLLAPAD